MFRRHSLLLFGFFALTLLGLLTIGTPALPAQETQIVNDEVSVVRVFFDNELDMFAVAAERDIWTVDFNKRFFVVDVDDAGWRELEALGFRVELDEEATASIRRVEQAQGESGGGIPGYACYRTVEETFATAESIVVNHPDLAQWLDVGDSWEKANPGQGFPGDGYDMRVLRLTNFNVGDPDAKPKLFITSSIHAREYTPAETNTRFAEYLIDNYGVDADATWLIDHHDIHLMLQANPDGRKQAETGLSWRKNTNNNVCSNSNSRGVDLNRNFPFQWGCCGGSSGSQCSLTYRGTGPASEPETQAVFGHMQSIFPDQRGPGLDDPAPDDAMGVYIDIHSYSELVLWSWGFTNQVPPNGTGLQTLGRKFAYYNDYMPEQSIGLYPTDGTTKDTAYGELGVAGYTFELGTAFFQGCSTFESTIFPDNLQALVYAAKAARTPYLTPAGPDAVDVTLSNNVVAPGAVVTLSTVADDTRFSANNGTEPAQNIAGVRIYIDTPPWQAGATGLPLLPDDGSFDEPVEAASRTARAWLSSGQHTIYVQAEDADGNLGAVSAEFLYIIDPVASPIVQGNVRDDVTGNGVAATVAVGPFTTNTNPATGFYQIQVPAGTYDMVVTSNSHAGATRSNVVANDFDTVVEDFDLLRVCTIARDRVENGNIGWVAQAPWAITDETASSGTFSWTDSPGGNYANNRNVSITSPRVNLSSYTDVSLRFDQICDTEAGYDYCRVEVSTNGGSTWDELAIFDGPSTDWETVELGASNLDGQSDVKVRFRFTSDGSVIDDGWHLDNLTLRGSGLGCYSAEPLNLFGD